MALPESFKRLKERLKKEGIAIEVQSSCTSKLRKVCLRGHFKTIIGFVEYYPPDGWQIFLPPTNSNSINKDVEAILSLFEE